MKKFLFAAIIFTISAVTAQSATYAFRYEFANSPTLVTGSFEGDLQGDGNTIFMSAVNNDLKIDGNPFITSFGPLDSLYPLSGFTPFITLDGTQANFMYTNTTTNEGFLLLTGSTAYLTEDSSRTSIFDSGNGRLTVSAGSVVVPLPAGLPLLGAGLGLLAIARRRGQLSSGSGHAVSR